MKDEIAVKDDIVVKDVARLALPGVASLLSTLLISLYLFSL